MKNTQKKTSGYAPIHRGQLYYETAGEGVPVLLLHAGVADCTMWDNQMDLFSQRYRFVYTGLFSAFQQAGFSDGVGCSATRPLMRFTI